MKTLYQFQQEGVDFLLNGGSLLAFQPGAGKEHPTNCRIMTPHGWRAIGELDVGDVVTGSAGQPILITGVYPQGVKPIYRVTFSDGSNVEAGAEHLWTVERNTSYGRRVREVFATAQLAEHPFIVGRRRGGQRLYLPMLSAPVQFTPKTLPLPAYLVGQLIANGSMANKDCSLTINAADEHAITTRLHLLGQEWRRSQYVKSVVRLSFSGFMPILRDLGMCELSRNKAIPTLYMRAEPGDRIALLQGLMDGDGSISANRNRVTYHTTSINLARDVRELVEGLGGIGSVRTYDRSHEGKPTDYGVRMRLPEWVMPFSTPRKANRYVPGRSSRPCRTVASVEYSREAEAVCIAVDAPDSLYATEHCILTHNTVTAIEACKRAGAKRVLAICPAVALGVWRTEIRDHWPECHPIYLRDVVNSPSFHPQGIITPFVLITGYEYLVVNQCALETVVQSCYDVLICDESHALKNPSAKRTITVYGPGCAGQGVASLAERTWLLTGTPVLNHVGEVFSHLRALAPERIEQRSYQGFVHHYCEIGVRTVYLKAKPGKKAQSKNIETITGSNRAALPELAKRLRGFWLKPKLEELNAQLPPMQLVVRMLTADACDATALAEIEDSEEAALLRKAIVQEQSLDQIEGQVSRLRRLLALAKVKATVEWLNDLQDQGITKIGVWGWHTAALEEIAAKFHDAVMITGKTPSVRREKLVKRFQEDSSCRLFIGQIQAAGTAITLTAAHRAVFIEQSFVPALNLQALKRHHRIGQKFPVMGEALVIEGSIDEAVGHILARKSSDIALLEESA